MSKLSGMDEPSEGRDLHLRELAAKCRRVAADLTDQNDVRSLRQMAAEYDAMANRIEFDRCQTRKLQSNGSQPSGGMSALALLLQLTDCLFSTHCRQRWSKLPAWSGRGAKAARKEASRPIKPGYLAN